MRKGIGDDAGNRRGTGVKKRRADAALYDDLNLESLQLARALIMEGRVLAGDRKIRTASEAVKDGEVLRVKGQLDSYVSRGAHKLKKALDVFSIDLGDAVCVDVGASTGGFTDVMLRAGAGRVYCVDVGYNLLDYRLRSDPRVTVLERTNARFLTAEHFGVPPEFGATDVSFISLKAVLPAVLPLLTGRREFVALIKPQFEAAKEDVGEKGVVRDPDVHRRVLRDMLAFVRTTGWAAAGLDFSPVRGPEGNIEFLLHLLPRERVQAEIGPEAINDIITSAYDKFFKSAKEGL